MGSFKKEEKIILRLCKSASWWFFIQRGGERNHVNWLFFLVLWRRCLLSWVSLTANQFVFWTHWGNDRYHTPAWRKTILLLSKLTLGLSGIRVLELAGPDCLFENTLHDFSWFCWLGFSKTINRDRSKEKKKRRSTSRRNNKAGSSVLESSKQSTYGQIWHCHAYPVRNLSKNHTTIAWCRIKRWKSQLAGRCDIDRAILCDFASPDSQIAMETSIIGCRIARFCFSVTCL